MVVLGVCDELAVVLEVEVEGEDAAYDVVLELEAEFGPLVFSEDEDELDVAPCVEEDPLELVEAEYELLVDDDEAVRVVDVLVVPGDSVMIETGPLTLLVDDDVD